MYPSIPLPEDRELSLYFICIVVGPFLGLFLGLRLNKRQPNPYPISFVSGLVAFSIGFILSKLYWIIQYDSIWNAYRALFFWETYGGFVSYGWIIGGMIGFSLYFKIKRVPFWACMDMVGIYVPLGHAIGRLGCLLGGCCAGKMTDLPWGVSYPPGAPTYWRQVNAGLIERNVLVDTFPVHPVQAYELIGLLLSYIFLRFLFTRKKHDGLVSVFYFICYGFVRFVVEFFRGDVLRPVFGLFTASQTFALLWLVAGTTTLLVLKMTIWRDKPFDATGTGQNERISPE